MLSKKTRDQAVDLMKAVGTKLLYPSGERKNAKRDETMEECMAALALAEDICRKELSADRFSCYEESFSVLFTGVEKLQGGEGDAEIASLSLQLLDWIIHEVRQEPVKKEIVFLPYKASMWDSLESIWQAAIADREHCNAYVIAIPYADLTPAHTAKEWHLEKDLFPKYVPVLDFRSVDLERLHPDVIFIHNPYDWANHVTSVDCHYYSDKLKKYTERLVYVPYFVSRTNVSAGVCQAPGIIHADAVVVESDAIRVQYERYYPSGNPPPGKFFSLGSPKYDKVQNGRKEDFPLPKLWQKRAQGKKIILYNTSLRAALTHSEDLCDKLRHVFAVAQTNEKVLLWWRPHPLMKSTLEAMRPHIAAEYRALEERYMKEELGIYDETPNVTRAVLWGDVYYGDESSVVDLFQVTGKPLMIETFLHENGAKWQPRDFFYVAAEGHWIWFLSKIFGAGMALFEMDLNTDEVVCRGELPQQEKRFVGSEIIEYSVLAKVGGKIIMAPFCSENGFMEYDCLTHEFYLADTQPSLWAVGLRYSVAFSNVVTYHGSAFFVGNGAGIIVEYNGQEQQYFYHTVWAEALAGIIPKEKMIFDRYGCCLWEGWLYLVTAEAPALICLNLDTMEVQAKRIPYDVRISYITCDGEDFWLLSSYDRKMIRWDGNEFQVINIEGGQGEFPFCGCMPFAGAVAVFSRESGSVIRVDKSGARQWVKIGTTHHGKCQCCDMGSQFTAFSSTDKRGFALQMNGGDLMEIEAATGRIIYHRQSVIPFTLDAKRMQNWKEGEILSFEEFMENAFVPENVFGKRGEAGQKIYTRLVYGDGGR